MGKQSTMWSTACSLIWYNSGALFQLNCSLCEWDLDISLMNGWDLLQWKTLWGGDKKILSVVFDQLWFVHTRKSPFADKHGCSNGPERSYAKTFRLFFELGSQLPWFLKEVVQEGYVVWLDWPHRWVSSYKKALQCLLHPLFPIFCMQMGHNPYDVSSILLLQHSQHCLCCLVLH